MNYEKESPFKQSDPFSSPTKLDTLHRVLVKLIRKVENQGGFMPFSNDILLGQHLNFPNQFSLIQSSATAYGTGFDHEQEETMAMSESLVEDSSSSPFSATTDFLEKNKKVAGYKRKRNNSRVEEKPKEVIHVRAKRGQATDSHSLAERLRREKINEKLRCLQDLVPGCYKAMGMAVMLDVIINYVLSLQQQIEFLSMNLSAASMYFDFNFGEMGATEIAQRSSSTYEIQGMERMAGEGYGGFPYFNPT